MIRLVPKFELICSDIDCTLIDNVHPICQSNLEAISYLKQKNVIFAVCTGKSYSISKDFCKQIGADFGIFGNGSHCVNLTNNEEIFKNVLPLSSLQICLNIIKRYNLHIHAYTETDIITKEPAYLDLRNLLLFPDKIQIKKVSDICNCLINSNILQLVVSSVGDLSNLKCELQQNVKGINITHIKKKGKYLDKVVNKEYEYLDIAASSSKGMAVTRLSNYLNIPKKKIIAIGDNVNDISMFNASYIGVAVNNAYDEVKEVADFITESSAGDGGFSEAIYHYLH